MIDVSGDRDPRAAREPRASLAPASSARAVEPAWYVVATKMRRERFAVEQLAQRRVEVFLPRIAIDRRGARIVRPLFPGYLFARLELPREWARVVWSPGVRRLVTFEGQPPPVPPAAIAFLQSQAGPDGAIVVRPRPLPAGRRVRVTSGPLAGLVGIIENPPDARGRVSVLMDILRTQTRVSIDVDSLEDA
jgi:transcriptional antiterminator RfaH